MCRLTYFIGDDGGASSGALACIVRCTFRLKKGARKETRQRRRDSESYTTLNPGPVVMARLGQPHTCPVLCANERDRTMISKQRTVARSCVTLTQTRSSRDSRCYSILVSRIKLQPYSQQYISGADIPRVFRVMQQRTHAIASCFIYHFLLDPSASLAHTRAPLFKQRSLNNTKPLDIYIYTQQFA